MTDFSRMLVVGDGDLASILACAAATDAVLLGQPDPALRRKVRPILWMPVFSGSTAAARQWAIRRQAELFEMEIIEPSGPAANGTTARRSPSAHPVQSIAAEIAGDAAGEWPNHTAILVAASFAAVSHGCSQVLWPMHTQYPESPDLDEVSRAVDRTLLVSRLIALDSDLHGHPAFRIDAPYIDYSDRQLADLVIDMDLPVRLCWWWHAEMAGDDGAAFRAARDRWTPLLREVGWRAESPSSSDTAPGTGARGL